MTEACPCDRTEDGLVNVFDLLAYLDDWFALDSSASCDAFRPIDVFDLLCFLDCWFDAAAGNPCS